MPAPLGRGLRSQVTRDSKAGEREEFGCVHSLCAPAFILSIVSAHHTHLAPFTAWAGSQDHPKPWRRRAAQEKSTGASRLQSSPYGAAALLPSDIYFTNILLSFCFKLCCFA